MARKKVRNMPRRQQKAVFAQLSGWEPAPRGMKRRVTSQGVQMRKVGVRNVTDKTARRMGRKRKKWIYSSTDTGPRGHPIG